MPNHWLAGPHFGNRARIGVVAPAAGTVLDHEWARLLPAGVMAPGIRVPLHGGSSDHLLEFVREVPKGAATLSAVKPDVVALACALGTAFRGPAREHALLQDIGAASGRPALGMAAAAASALRTLGARRVALLTPYSDEANGWLRDYLIASGFEAGGSARLGVPPAAAGDLDPSAVGAAVRELLASDPAADAVWLACGNVRSLEIIAELERETGRIIVSSNLALLWAALRACGLADRIEGAGLLMQH